MNEEHPEPGRPAAACLGQTDLFFSSDPAGIAEAIAICHGCPVFDGCFEFTFATRELYGTRAGTSEEERQELFEQAGPLRLFETAGRVA